MTFLKKFLLTLVIFSVSMVAAYGYQRYSVQAATISSQDFSTNQPVFSASGGGQLIVTTQTPFVCVSQNGCQGVVTATPQGPYGNIGFECPPGDGYNPACANGNICVHNTGIGSQSQGNQNWECCPPTGCGLNGSGTGIGVSSSNPPGFSTAPIRCPAGTTYGIDPTDPSGGSSCIPDCPPGSFPGAGVGGGIICRVVTPTPRLSPSATPVLPAPQLDLKIRKAGTSGVFTDGPITVNLNDKAELQWTSQNVSSCTATNGWNGSKVINGTEVNATPLQSTTVFVLTCTGNSGVVSDLVVANVIQPTPSVTPTPSLSPSTSPTPSLSPTPTPLLPSLDLKGRATGSGAPFVDGPITVNQGQSVDLQWVSQNVTTCTATNGWNGSKVINGTEIESPLSAGRIYNLSCTGPYGQVSDLFVVNVIAPTPTPVVGVPYVDIKIRVLNSGNAFTDGPLTIYQGQPVELQWTSQDVTSCTAGSNWAGIKAINGTEAIGSLNNSSTFIINCTGPDGAVSDATSVQVLGPTYTYVPPPYYPPPVYNAPPTVDIKVHTLGTNDVFTDGPITINQGQAPELQWQSQNATSCQATNGWNGTKYTSGTEAQSALTGSRTYTIICYGPGGSSADSVTVFVNASQNPLISLAKSARDVTTNGTQSPDIISANPGDIIEFTITLQSIGNTPAQRVSLRDALPSNLTYIPGTLTLNGAQQFDGLINSSIVLNDMAQGATSTLQFRATVAGAGSFPVGNTTILNTAIASYNDNHQASDNVVVAVQNPAPPNTPPQQQISFTKRGRNVSLQATSFQSTLAGRPGNMLEFSLTLTSPNAYDNIFVRDILPSGLSYIPNSTTVDGRALGDGIVSATGVGIGATTARQKIEVRFSAIVASALDLPKGITYLTNFAEAISNTVEIGPLAQLPITITNANGPAAVVVAGHVPTGSTGGLVFALFAAICLTFVFNIYTRTSGYRVSDIKKEIELEKKDKDRFNFN